MDELARAERSRPGAQRSGRAPADRAPARRAEPFRLLWLIDSLTLGGAEALAVAFARAVDLRRVRLRVACLKAIAGNPFERELRRAGVEVVNLETRHLRDHHAFRRLLALLRGERIERIHAHLEYASIWGAVASRLTGVPVTCTLHVSPIEGHRPVRGAARQRLRVGLMNRYASDVLAVSEWARDRWVGVAGLSPALVRVVPNGIDCRAHPSALSPGELREALGFPPWARLAITVAALREDKGLDLLVEAAPRVLEREPRARFVVVGEGPARAGLLERCGRVGLDAWFRWAGFRPDARALLPGSDVFVLPTRRDALPTAVLEAMAAGLPVVATRVGGLPEMVEGPEGILVPPEDPGSLADAVATLLANPAEARSRGEAGRRRARQEYSIGAWLARLERVYGRTLRGYGRTLRATDSGTHTRDPEEAA